MKFVETKWYSQLIQISDYILLGILWVIVSLPIITVIPASAAVFETMTHWSNGESGRVVFFFWQGFKKKLGINLVLSFLTGSIYFLTNLMVQESSIVLVVSGYVVMIIYTMFLLSWLICLSQSKQQSIVRLFQESTMFVLINFLKNGLCCVVLLTFTLFVFMFPPIIFLLAGGVWCLIYQLMNNQRVKGVWQ